MRRTRQWSCPGAVWLAVGVALATAFPAVAVEGEAPELAVGEPSGDVARQHVLRAMQAVDAERWSEASAAFLAAADATGAQEDKASLLFNAAVAAYNSGDFQRAEELFVSSAELLPSRESQCYLHAGLAALEQGEVSRAREHRARVTGAQDGDAELRVTLDERLLEATQAESRSMVHAALQDATTAYQRGDRVETERQIAKIMGQSAMASQEERAAALLLRGYLAHDAGQLAAAKAAYLEHVSLTKDPFLGHIALGDLSIVEGSPKEAQDRYQRALLVAHGPEQIQLAEARIARAFPIPASRLFASMSLEVGYDSNAIQSGTSPTVGIASSAGATSFFLVPSLSLERPFRFNTRLAIAPYYAGSGTLLLAPAVQEYSIHGHEAGVLLYWALGGANLLRLGASATLDLSGLATMSPFMLQGWFGAELGLSSGGRARTKIALGGRPSLGLGDRPELTGGRFDASVRETLVIGRNRPFVQLGGVLNLLGNYVVPLNQIHPIDCGDFMRWVDCDELGVSVAPLGYTSPWIAMGDDYYPHKRITLSLGARLDYRLYNEESYVLAAARGPGPGSFMELNRKRREDLLLSAKLSGAWRLGPASPMFLTAAYRLLVSRSNMAQDMDDPDHEFDYANRNFVQHVVTLGVRADL